MIWILRHTLKGSGSGKVNWLMRLEKLQALFRLEVQQHKTALYLFVELDDFGQGHSHRDASHGKPREG